MSSIQQTASGSFEQRGDTDWYRVHLIAGTTYQLSSSVQNLVLQLYLPDAQTVLTTPVSFTNFEDFVAPVTGDYFVSAHGIGAPGSYSFSVLSFDDPIPGSTATTATIAVGGTVHADHTTPGFANNDWFATDLVAGQSYELSIAGSGFNYSYLLDANGHTVVAGGQDSHFTPTVSGRYYAGVFASSAYDLTLRAVADDHPDNYASAGSVTVGTPVTGTWESPADADWYAVTLQAGSSYAITSTAANQGSVIQFLNSSGTFLKLETPSAPGSTTTEVSAATTGTYYIGVSRGSDADPLATATYSLSVTQQNSDLADNALTTGTVTVGGAAVQGSFLPGHDGDWFAVSLTQGQSYDFTLNTGSGSGTSFALYDSAGNQVASSPGSINTGNGLHHTAETTGTYYLAAGSDHAATYTVSATAIADDFADSASTTGHLTAD